MVYERKDNQSNSNNGRKRILPELRSGSINSLHRRSNGGILNSGFTQGRILNGGLRNGDPFESRNFTSLQDAISENNGTANNRKSSLSPLFESIRVEFIALNIAKSFEARKLGIKKWDKLYRSRPQDQALSKVLIEIMNAASSIDIKPLNEYFEYIRTLNEDTVINVNPSYSEELHTAIDLICEQRDSEIISGNFKFPENQDRLSNYIYSLSQKIIDIVKDSQYLKNWDAEKCMNLLMGICSVVCFESVPQYLDKIRDQFVSGKYVKDYFLFTEWVKAVQEIVFNVANDLMKDDQTRKLSEFNSSLDSFKNANIKRYTYPKSGLLSIFSNNISNFESFLSFLYKVVNVIKDNSLLPKINERLKKHTWMQEWPYNSTDIEEAKLKGGIILTIRTRDKEDFIFYYDTKNKVDTVGVVDTKDEDINGHSVKLVSLSPEMNVGVLETINNCACFSIDHLNNVYTHDIDRHINQDDKCKCELRDNGKRLLKLGKTFLAILEKEIQGVFDPLESCHPIMVNVNEGVGYCNIIGTKKFFQENTERFIKVSHDKEHILAFYDDIAKDEEGLSYVFKLDIISYFRSGYIQREVKHEDKEIKSQPDVDYSKPLQEKEYLDKILQYIRKVRGVNANKVSLEWLEKFLKPIGVFRINKDEGKGDHSKLRMQVNDEGFWSLSPRIIKEGIYLTSIGEIIKALNLTCKQVYEICVLGKNE